MKFRQTLITLFGWLLMITIVQAEVVLDGTLGPKGTLQGPNFLIDARFGRQVGPNLFHSFETFNVNNTESAVFMGPTDIDNVISRVTGGQASFIDGSFASIIPNADVYFINPAGIMFGPNAAINVPGSFYISTADYLKLGEKDRFYANPSQESLLTIAPPSAFGFLEAPNSITIEQSVLSFPNRNTLLQIITGEDIPTNATFSIIGGDIFITDGQIITGGNNIHLVSIASQGEVPVDAMTLTDNSFAAYGTLSIIDTGAFPKNQFGNIEVSGLGGGAIFIRAGQLFLDNAWIFADTWQNKAGRGITVHADNTLMKNSSLITTQSLSPKNPNAIISSLTGNAGSITITTGNLSITGGSQVNSNTQTAGTAGNLTILAQQSLSIRGTNEVGNVRSGVLSNTLGLGSGGEVAITAENLMMDEGATISAKTQSGVGPAGNLSLNVGTLTLSNGAQIDVSTGNRFQISPDAGNAGQLTIKAKNSVQISGISERSNTGLISNVFSKGQGGTIEITSPKLTIEKGGSIQAATFTSGHAGNVKLNVDSLRLSYGGRIQTNTFGSGQGGQVDIIANEGVVIDGALAGIGASVGKLNFGENIVFGTGQGGDINIQTGDLQLIDTTIEGGISARSFGSGNAGNIVLALADKLQMQNSFITTETTSADGGNITITTPRYLYLRNSEISTSVGTGFGSGGNISLAPKFIIQDNSPIIAEAFGGPGGNIDITTTGIYRFPGGDNRISASSQFGVDGVVQIETPDENVSEGMLALSSSHMDASKMMKTPCEAMSYEEYMNRPRFIVYPITGSPRSPFDLQPSRFSLTIFQQIIQKKHPNFFDADALALKGFFNDAGTACSRF